MNRRFRFSLSIVQCSLFIVCCAPLLAQTAPSDLSPQDLANELSTHDAPTLTAALTQALQRLGDDPAQNVGNARNLWLKSLIAADHPDEALRLSQAALLAAPQDSYADELLLRQRIALLLQLHHNDEALAQSKSLFNVCPPQNTDTALLLLAECLNAAHGNNSGDVDLLIAEQRAALAAPVTENTPHPPTSPTLQKIPVNPGPYQPAIHKFLLPSGDLPLNFQDLLAVGNLYLLADQPADALNAFRHLQKLATPDQLRTANDGLARALRAQDGTPARANAFARTLAGGT
jgi:hypothetical protein